MKVTHKLNDQLPKIVKASKNEEIAPSLFLRGLSSPIDGLEAGQDFHGHVKGKCRAHSIDKKEDGKEHHTYDLDIHDFEHAGGGDGKKSMPKKKSSTEEVAEAMDKFDKEEAEKKTKK